MVSLPASFSRLGLGITGPHASAAVSRDATVALIAAAVAAGVTLFDTGPMYGDGEGERRLGAALKGLRRDDVFICTKARTWPLKADTGPAMAPADRVRRSLEASLHRLGVDRVDALLLHGPAPTDFTPPLMAALERLRGEGVVGRLGVCGRGAELDAALDVPAFDLMMAPLSGPLARAAAQGVTVMAIETMRGKASPWRIPRSRADLWYLARAARDALRGVPPPDAGGIGAALGRPAVRTVVVQTTRLAHLRANAAAARG